MNTKEKGKKTKELIVSKAMDLFMTKGYDSATMQNIMDSTGLSKGAVYHHFESKNEILEYAMNAELNSVTSYLESIVKSNELTPVEKMYNIFDYSLNNVEMQSLAKFNWTEKIPFGLLFTLKNTLNVLSKYVAEIIKQGNRNGDFDCKYPNETASVLLLLVDIWLDPNIVDSSYEEILLKVDYIYDFLIFNNVPILSDEELFLIKEKIKVFYVNERSD